MAGRFRGARGEDGADKWARAVNGWARGRGRLPGAACWAGAAAGPTAGGPSGEEGEESERAAEERACRPKPRKGVERRNFLFLFINKIFKSHFQGKFEFNSNFSQS